MDGGRTPANDSSSGVQLHIIEVKIKCMAARPRGHRVNESTYLVAIQG